MTENEAILLQRFATGADAEAFAELVRRYARMVYSTSWRVLKDEGEATDVTQETFFELTRKAGRISGSLGCWLHRVATQKSIDVIRRSVRRRKREQTYARTRPVEVESWQDLSGHVDLALDTLDKSSKSLLLDHFIAGKTTSELARERGVSQATISRRIHAGLDKLRGVLRRKGLLVTAATLSTMLTENTAQAISETLLGSLGKMAMVGTTRTAAVTVTKAGAVKALLATTGFVGVLSVGVYVHQSRPVASPEVPATPISAEAPRGAAGRQVGSARGGQAALIEVTTPAVEDEAGPVDLAVPEEPTPESHDAAAASQAGGIWGGWSVGGFQDAVDLSTPAAAVYSLLTLIDEGATDQLGLCLIAEDAHVTDGPYPRHVGQPIRLIDIFEDGQAATVQWEATTHTAFDHADRHWSPGEYVPFTSHLILDDSVWKLAVFME